MLALNLAQTLAGALENMLFHEDRVTLVVPGGETPRPVFDNLCAADIDWSRVDVTLSDERCLPDVHLRSNARLIKKNDCWWGVQLRRGSIHSMLAKKRPRTALRTSNPGWCLACRSLFCCWGWGAICILRRYFLAVMD